MLTVCTTSQAYFESPENKKISKCCFMGGSQNRPQFPWAASGDAPEREARPLPTMTHIVFRWWTSLKSKAPPPNSSLIWSEAACLWAAGKTSYEWAAGYEQ